jgi:hypothetical protein
MAHPIELTVTVCGLTLDVHYFEGHAGTFGGPPDAWCPPDPPEVEVVRAVDAAGTVVEVDLGEDDDLYEAIVEACIEPLQTIYGEWAEAEAVALAEIEAAAAEWEARAV